MEKIINYIKNGKGLGLLFLLAGSVLITIMYMFVAKEIIKDFEPKVMLIANDFLPLTVNEQKITSPLDTYKRIEINLSDDEQSKDLFPVVLDTKNKTQDLKNEKIGLFITQDSVILKTFNDTKNLKLKDGVYDINTFKQMYTQTFGKVSLIASILLIIGFFLSLLTRTVITALVGLLGVKLLKITSPIDLNYTMRLSAIIISFIDVATHILANFLPLNITSIHTLILGIIIELIFLNKQKNDTSNAF